MRRYSQALYLLGGKFQLTHPTRGATSRTCKKKDVKKFQLTHPTRGATNYHRYGCSCSFISTHTPHTECDYTPTAQKCAAHIFQLTHPTRSATIREIHKFHCLIRFQLTHPTRSATPIADIESVTRSISTHTPHTECDEFQRIVHSLHLDFNSHTPHGVRQKKLAELESVQKISTHTPHTECDIKNPRPVLAAPNISTHTPHTECDCSPNSKKDLYTRFQLTHPTRSATL